MTQATKIEDKCEYRFSSQIKSYSNTNEVYQIGIVYEF